MFLFKKTSEIAIKLKTKHCFLGFYSFPLCSDFCSTLLISAKKFFTQDEIEKTYTQYECGDFIRYGVGRTKKIRFIGSCLWLRKKSTIRTKNETRASHFFFFFFLPNLNSLNGSVSTFNGIQNESYKNKTTSFGPMCQHCNT